MGLFDFDEDVESNDDSTQENYQDSTENRGDELTNIHNQGEIDYNNKTYSPPNEHLVTLMLSNQKEFKEDFNAYEKGWNNAKKQ